MTLSAGPGAAGSCAGGAPHHRPRRHDLAEHGPRRQPHGHREPDDDQRPPRPRPAGRGARGAGAVALPGLPAAPRRRRGCPGSCRGGRTTRTSTWPGTCTSASSLRRVTTGPCRSTSPASSSDRCARDRPLWEMHVLHGYGEGSAVYSRLHHSLADGIALTKVLLSLTDASPDGTLRRRRLARPPTDHGVARPRRTPGRQLPRRGGSSRRRGQDDRAGPSDDRRGGQAAARHATPPRRSPATRARASGRSGAHPVPLADDQGDRAPHGHDRERRRGRRAGRRGSPPTRPSTAAGRSTSRRWCR